MFKDLPQAAGHAQRNISLVYFIPSWWFQPISKICSSNWIISPRIGVKIKHIWSFTTKIMTYFLSWIVWALCQIPIHYITVTWLVWLVWLPEIDQRKCYTTQPWPTKKLPELGMSQSLPPSLHTKSLNEVYKPSIMSLMTANFGPFRLCPNLAWLPSCCCRHWMSSDFSWKGDLLGSSEGSALGEHESFRILMYLGHIPVPPVESKVSNPSTIWMGPYQWTPK